MNILILGGTGFIGQALIRRLLKKNHNILIGCRHHDQVKKNWKGRVKTFFWSAGQPINPYYLKNIDVVYHLAGAPISEKWTEFYKKEILFSRVQPLQDLADGIKLCHMHRPQLIMTSAIGYYGESVEEIKKDSPPGNDFLSKVCINWEKAALEKKHLFSRINIIRTGIVLHPSGGLELTLGNYIKKGLGIIFGKGDNYLSTIKLSELIALLEAPLIQENIPSILLGVTENITQKELSAKIALRYNKKIRIKLPQWLVKLIWGEQSILFMGNQKIKPEPLSVLSPDQS